MLLGDAQVGQQDTSDDEGDESDKRQTLLEEQDVPSGSSVEEVFELLDTRCNTINSIRVSKTPPTPQLQYFRSI